MDETLITSYIASLAGVEVQVASAENGAPEVAWGDSFFFYDPDRRLVGANKFPFATIVTKDYKDFDNQSQLNRDGVFRLNIGLSPESYDSLFPGGTRAYDFSRLDLLMPHPVYGKNHWVCVLNPSAQTFESLKPLIAEAHSRAASRYQKLVP
jgi:hypothetical protein